jgi:phospholipase D3/4
MLGYLHSLRAINPVLPLHIGGKRGQINIRLFTVPSTPQQKRIDHGRVNHNKYMVTERAAYVGTSNWAGDYFITTAGVGVVFQQIDSGPIVAQFNDVFERDWSSEYSSDFN